MGLASEDDLAAVGVEPHGQDAVVVAVLVPNVLLFYGPAVGALVWLSIATKSWHAGAIVLWTIDIVLTVSGAVILGFRTRPQNDMPIDATPVPCHGEAQPQD